MDPVPTGATAIDPPDPVLMVAVAPDTVSMFTVKLALLAVPELIERAEAPLLASTMPPLSKLRVGELMKSPAPDWTVCVELPKLID